MNSQPLLTNKYPVKHIYQNNDFLKSEMDKISEKINYFVILTRAPITAKLYYLFKDVLYFSSE